MTNTTGTTPVEDVVDDLTRDGYRRDDVLAAVDSLIAAGLETADVVDDDGTVDRRLTDGEVDLVREQLRPAEAAMTTDEHRTEYRIRTSTGAEIGEDRPALVVVATGPDGDVEAQWAILDGTTDVEEAVAEVERTAGPCDWRDPTDWEAIADEYGGETVLVGSPRAETPAVPDVTAVLADAPEVGDGENWAEVFTTAWMDEAASQGLDVTDVTDPGDMPDYERTAGVVEVRGTRYAIDYEASLNLLRAIELDEYDTEAS